MSDAYADGVIGPLARELLEKIAKGLPYRERAYHAIISLGRDAGVAEEEISQFGDWLPTGRVDQKREDAVLMLQVMRQQLRESGTATVKTFYFEHTTLWEQATRRAVQANGVSTES